MAFLHNKLIILARDVIRGFFRDPTEDQDVALAAQLVVVMAQPGTLIAHKLISII